MHARSTAYWISTSLITLNFSVAGVAYLLRVEPAAEAIAELGYPAYVLTILGIFKLLGAAAIIAPGFPRVKEWAYAGVCFNLVGASVSHLAAGHPAVRIVGPLVILGIAAISWRLRPENRASSTLQPVLG